jgi:hypothetical protein
MFREQMVNFLEAAVVFLLLTNVVIATAATCAIRMVKVMGHAQQEAGSAVSRKIDGMLRRAG